MANKEALNKVHLITDSSITSGRGRTFSTYRPKAIAHFLRIDGAALPPSTQDALGLYLLRVCSVTAVIAFGLEVLFDPGAAALYLPGRNLGNSMRGHGFIVTFEVTSFSFGFGVLVHRAFAVWRLARQSTAALRGEPIPVFGAGVGTSGMETRCRVKQ